MINKLVEFRKKVDKTKQFFIKQACYLKPGAYVLDDTLRLIYRDDKDTIKFVNNVIIKNNYNLAGSKSIKSIIKSAVIGKKIIIENNNKHQEQDFSGSVYLPANTTGYEKEIKIFDFESMRVLTKYSNENNFEKKIKTYEMYNKYFPIPNIISYDSSRKITLEKLVVSKPKNEWDRNDFDKVVDSIFNYYKKYFIDYTKMNEYKADFPAELLYTLKQDNIFLELANKLEENISKELISMRIPMALQHGDLWFYNILLSDKNEGTIYLIDWEHSGEYFLFYDLFWWMQNEAVYGRDYTYIYNYLSGEYDQHFKLLFEAFDIQYNEKLRYDYFNISLLEIIYKRILSQDEFIKKIALDLYMPMLINLDRIYGLCKLVD